MKGKLAFFLIASCAVSAGVCAQPVYRCGSTYTNIPCAADAGQLDVQDSRTAEQQAQTAAGVQKEAKLAKKLEKERLKREAQERAALRQAQKNAPSPTVKTVKVVKSLPHRRHHSAARPTKR